MKKLLLFGLVFFIGQLAHSQSLSSVQLVDVNDAKTYSLSQIVGSSKTLIIFFDNDCPYVSSYESRIKDLANFAASNKFNVLFVNPHQEKNPTQNSLSQMKDFMKKVNWNGRFLSDSKQELVGLIKANKLPEVFIVEVSNDKLKVLFNGPIDDNPQNAEAVNYSYAKSAIDSLLKKEEIGPMVKVNTMGCRIKRY